jgi:hypothetical protein
VTLPAWSQLIAGSGMRLGWGAAVRLATSALPPFVDSGAGMRLGWHAAVRLATSALPLFVDLTHHNSAMLQIIGNVVLQLYLLFISHYGPWVCVEDAQILL